MIKDLEGERTLGMTIRVGRTVKGLALAFEELLASNKNVLVLGNPGSGRTTMLREFARFLASKAHSKHVVLLDSTQAIGEGKIQQSAYGKARRIEVQSAALAGAITNAAQRHGAQCVLLEQTSTAELAASESIKRLGVRLIAGANASTLAQLLADGSLRALLGCASDSARNGALPKERRAEPLFDAFIEIRSNNNWRVCNNLSAAVDALLDDALDAECQVQSFDAATQQLHEQFEFYPDSETRKSFS